MPLDIQQAGSGPLSLRVVVRGRATSASNKLSSDGTFRCASNVTSAGCDLTASRRGSKPGPPFGCAQVVKTRLSLRWGMPSAVTNFRDINDRRFSCHLPQPLLDCCPILPMQAVLETANRELCRSQLVGATTNATMCAYLLGSQPIPREHTTCLVGVQGLVGKWTGAAPWPRSCKRALDVGSDLYACHSVTLNTPWRGPSCGICASKSGVPTGALTTA